MDIEQQRELIQACIDAPRWAQPLHREPFDWEAFVKRATEQTDATLRKTAESVGLFGCSLAEWAEQIGLKL